MISHKRNAGVVTIACYDVGLKSPVRCTMCGTREPTQPFPQPRRELPDFVAFLVTKGEIFLTDEMPGGSENIRVRPGEIHIIAPGLWQSSTVPFAPGIRFIWFHFSFTGGYKLRDGAEAAEIVKEMHRPRAGVAPQPRWLIPRHLALGDELDSFARMHETLVLNTRLWGLNDTGTQLICGHMVYDLHRLFAAQVLRSASLDAGRSSPESAHVSRAQNFIRLNYEDDISLAEVAEAVSLNPSYLSRCFKKATGMTVVDFLLKTRIDAAKALLSETTVPAIKEVAFTTGFASAAYFCRVFKRLERQTAMQFAEKARRRG